MLPFDTESTMSREQRTSAGLHELVPKLAGLTGTLLGKAVRFKHTLEHVASSLQRFAPKNPLPAEIFEYRINEFYIRLSLLLLIFFALSAGQPLPAVRTIANNVDEQTGKTTEGLASQKGLSQAMRDVFIGKPPESIEPPVYQEVEVAWTAPDKTPAAFKQWEWYVNDLVDLHYDTYRHIFELHRFTKHDVKTMVMVIIIFENNGDHSRTDDYGPLAINSIHFKPVEDPNNIWTQAYYGMWQLAMSLEQANGDTRIMFGKYNAGAWNVPNDEYGEPTDTMLNAFNGKLGDDYHVVGPGDTVSGLWFEYGAPMLISHYNRYTEDTYHTGIINDFLRVGMVLQKAP